LFFVIIQLVEKLNHLDEKINRLDSALALSTPRSLFPIPYPSGYT
jgi:hypothetical protein